VTVARTPVLPRVHVEHVHPPLRRPRNEYDGLKHDLQLAELDQDGVVPLVVSTGSAVQEN
jgi:hypothetical protein